MNEGLKITKQAIAGRQDDGFCQMVDIELQPDEAGLVTTSLEGGVDVLIDVQTRTITAEGNEAPKITRTYQVGHPNRSGDVTELQLKPLAVIKNGQVVERITFCLDNFSLPFPDGRSYMKIRGGTGQESVTLF